MTSPVRFLQQLSDRYVANKVCAKISPTLFAVDEIRKKSFVEDPDLYTSLSLLRSLTSGERENEAAGLLEAVLKADQQVRKETIRIGEISAIWASKGRYIGNLPRLKYTGSYRGPHLWNPPRHMQQTLWSQIEWEFAPSEEGFFCVDREEWSGRLIAHNSGAARRFCWAQYYDSERELKCEVTNWRLDSEIIEELNARYWLCILPTEIYKRVAHTDLTALRRRWFTLVCHVSAIRRDGSRDPWKCCAIKRDDRFFPKLRNSLLDAGVPLYDVSSWLLQLQSGRRTP